MNDIIEIMDVLPHRYPFLLVDRVMEMGDDWIKAYKNVTFNEPFFTGHFPGRPVMPGVLVVEAMAQAGAFLVFGQIEDRKDKLIYFSGIDKCRFRRPVVPGDQLIFDVKVLYFRRNVAKLDARALVDDELACQAELMSVMVERT
jgi:beta-hydroxyacyl-ACP dehydratase FabZ